MSTNLQKRVTKQIRIAINTHRNLKLFSIGKNKTISEIASKLLDDSMRLDPEDKQIKD